MPRCVPLLSLLLFVGCAAPVDTVRRGDGGDGGDGGRTKAEPGAVDPDAPEEFTETKSGLKYRIRRKGNGDHPNGRSMVAAHYKGWLDDGTVFDSSYDRGGAPVEFSLTRVIPGWTEGLQLVSEGGMIELEIPSDLGYGPGGMPPDIPGGATLHFLVELDHFH